MKLALYSTIILLSCFFFVAESAFGQSPNWLWAKSIGGSAYDDMGQIIAVDPATGNIYSTGSYAGPIDFDPGPGSFFLNGYGIFISKSDNAGNFLWAKAINGVNNSSLAVDTASGAIYATGYFYGTVDFDPGAGIFNLTTPQYYYFAECYDEYCGCYYDCSYYGNTSAVSIVKLDSGGNFVWAKAMVGSDSLSHGFGKFITVDAASGNVYNTGHFIGTVDFDPGPGTLNLTSAGTSDIFISKLDGSGNVIWAKSMGGTSIDYGKAIAIDHAGSGAVYTIGSFQGTSDFNPDGSTTFNLTSAGYDDMFISKLDSSGSFVWAKAIGGSNYDYINSIAVDPLGSGDICMTGSFPGTVDFDPGTGIFNLSTGSYYDHDIFIFKLGGSGNFEWALKIGSPFDYDYGNSIIIDPYGSGDIYTTGSFGGSTDFNPGMDSFILNTNGYNDIFISKLDDQGNFLWAKATGGTEFDAGQSIALGTSGNIYATGFFNSPTISFDSTTLANSNDGTLYFDDYGYPIYTSDIFIAKLNLVPACTSFVTNNNNSGSGSLRDIIFCSANGATITFDNSLIGQTIILTSGEIVINKNLVISGLGMLDLTISAHNNSRIFNLLKGRNLEIKNLSLKDAASATNGGAIFAKGQLTLDSVLMQNNFENGIPKSMTVTNTALVKVRGNVDIKN